MSEIRRCEEHGFHEGAECPICGARGEPVLDAERRRRLSKFVSGALRHFPGDAGLELDERGWTDADAVVGAIESKYDWADREALAGVVATDPKGRFEVDGVLASDASQGSSDERSESDGALSSRASQGSSDESGSGRIRAAYGHSVDVDLEPADGPVPDELYHGTAPGAVDAILEEGIRPMSRQLVHLSGTVDDALDVGARHADEPVLLVVDAAAMQADGHRITRRGRSVYTTERVPPAYVTVRE